MLNYAKLTVFKLWIHIPSLLAGGLTRLKNTNTLIILEKGDKEIFRKVITAGFYAQLCVTLQTSPSTP